MQFSVTRRLALGCLAAASFGAAPAVAGATSSGSFKLPAGDTFTLNQPTLNGCDDLSYGYKVGTQPIVTLGEKPEGCDAIVFDDTTVGPFARTLMFRVFLQDSFTTPPYVFWSTNRKHTKVSGTRGDWFIQTGDGDFGAAPPTVKYHNSNFTTKVEINS
jgi:hypothetical protein